VTLLHNALIDRIISAPLHILVSMRAKELLGRVPDLATADAGFFSAANEAEAKELGVKRVAIPSRSPKVRNASRNKRSAGSRRPRSGAPAAKVSAFSNDDMG